MPLHMQRSFLQQVRELLDRNLTVSEIAHRLGVNAMLINKSIQEIRP